MAVSNNRNNPNRHKIRRVILCLIALYITTQQLVVGGGQTPPANDQLSEKGERNNTEKVYLLFAETLEFDEARSADFQILRGNVQFRKDSMYMFCDSAYFYETSNSLDAFGNVRMEQGDTLFVYGDALYYNGNEQMARLRQNVRMENREVTLFTDSLNYDQQANIGYYFEGGKIVDEENELTSLFGEYSPSTKRAIFNNDVELVNEQYVLYSDTLGYSTESKIADIEGSSVIVSDSNTIYTDRGWYDTNLNTSMLLDRSLVDSNGQQLTGDTIYYDRNLGIGEVFGNMHLNDTTRKIVMEGQYGFYNEQTNYAFATRLAQMVEYSSSDTLFLHADTLMSQTDSLNNRILQAYKGVRFFRTDSQGVCDSVAYHTSDSLLTMYHNPVLWNGEYQLYGDTVKVFMNDSTIERTHIPAFAFAAQRKDSLYFDQLTGKDMLVLFDQGKMKQVDVSGNVQTIFYPVQEDSTLMGLNSAESSYLRMYLQEQKLEKLIMWPSVQGLLTPLLQIKKSMLFLPQFKWYDNIRPTSKEDIFRDTHNPTAPTVLPPKVPLREIPLRAIPQRDSVSTKLREKALDWKMEEREMEEGDSTPQNETRRGETPQPSRHLLKKIRSNNTTTQE